jgi:hypothetical protein
VSRTGRSAHWTAGYTQGGCLYRDAQWAARSIPNTAPDSPAMRAPGTDTSPNAAARVQHLHARSKALATQDIIAENVYAHVWWQATSGEFCASRIMGSSERLV